MDISALWFAFGAVGVGMALTLLIAINMQYRRLGREMNQEMQWDLMWHERIWETTDERDHGDGPP